MTTDSQPRSYPFEEFRGDLPAELLAMVESKPVSRVVLPDGRLTWLVVGYEEVCAVLSDQRVSRYAARHSAPAGQAIPSCPVRELSMDGPAHISLRRLAARPFTARRVESFRPRIQQITDDLLDDMVAGGQPADLISGLVAPLPALVVYEVLGVPVEDRERFAAWGSDLLSLTAYGSPDAARSRAELRAYLTGQLAVKRRSPADDLLSDWLAAQAGDQLTDDEIVGLALGVLIGGREISSTSAGLRALFLHPAELARLRAEPGLLPAAVEEILRYTAVSPMFLVQTVIEDLELGGTWLRKGDSVMAVPWAANRDQQVFPHPHGFRLDRAQNPHLTFGYGPHFCLGAALGRLQVVIAIGTLLRRFPRLAPAIPLDDLPWRHERFNCGIAEFPVTW